MGDEEGSAPAIRYSESKLKKLTYLRTTPLLNLLFEQGELFLKTGRRKEAAICFRRVVEAEPVDGIDDQGHERELRERAQQNLRSLASNEGDEPRPPGDDAYVAGAVHDTSLPAIASGNGSAKRLDGWRLRDLRYVMWLPTLKLNSLRLGTAGIAWGVLGFFVFIVSPLPNAPWYDPLLAMLVMPFAIPVVAVIGGLPMAAFGYLLSYPMDAVGFPLSMLPLMFILSAALLLVPGDPLLYILLRRHPAIISAEMTDMRLLNFTPFIFLFDEERLPLR
jgi:hypothetical protein